MRENYLSAREHMEKVKAHVEKDVEKGWMQKMDLAEAKERYGDDLQIASLGAVPKDAEWEDVRVAHDGTHGIRVNTEVVQPNKMAFPQYDDVEAVMKSFRKQTEGPRMLMAFDIKAAHRLVPIHPMDWGLQACRLEEEESVYVNTRGTFGVASAAFWWGRVAGTVFRTFHRLIPPSSIFYLLLFADDGLIFAGGLDYHKLILALFFYVEIMEIPMSWGKTRGGVQTEWIGYTVDVKHWKLGVGERKVEWLRRWCTWAKEQGRMLGRDFRAGLGRMGFLAGAARYARPFLAPLYAASAKVKGGSYFELQLATRLAMAFFLEMVGENPMRELSGDPAVLGEVFRVDAMADKDEVAVGGWETYETVNPKEARWFHVVLNRRNAPFLFVKGEPFRTIASAELLGVTVAILVFGPSSRWRNGAGRVSITGFTDNLSNAFLLDRFLTTKFPLSLILMELAKLLEEFGLDLDLAWIPREQNEEADDLSKGRYERFDMNNRVEVEMENIPFRILRRMLKAATELDAEIKEKKTSKEVAVTSNKVPAGQKLRVVQPW